MLHAARFSQTVDRFNNLLVTAFVTPGNARFLLLHDGRSDDNIKLFFMEIYELYVKVRIRRRKGWQKELCRTVAGLCMLCPAAGRVCLGSVVLRGVW